MGVSNRRDNSGGEGRVGFSNEQLSISNWRKEPYQLLYGNYKYKFVKNKPI